MLADILDGAFLEHISGQSQYGGDRDGPHPARQIELDQRVCATHAERGVPGSIAAREQEMLAIIIFIALLALAGAGLSVYVSRRSITRELDGGEAQTSLRGGLFDYPDQNVESLKSAHEGASQRAELLKSARSGDLETLSNLDSKNDAKLYSAVLDALNAWAFERQENLNALVSHISKSKGLRSNKQLAERMIEMWKTAPDRRSTVEMLHIAALSDDPATYQQAVELVFAFWKAGKLSELRSEEIVELLESQYWILTPHARRGGAGFTLKRTLAGVRRELATAARAH